LKNTKKTTRYWNQKNSSLNT